MKFTTAAVIGLAAISATDAQLTSILHNKYQKSNGEVDDVDVVGGVGSFRKLSDSDGSMSIAMIETQTDGDLIQAAWDNSLPVYGQAPPSPMLNRNIRTDDIINKCNLANKPERTGPYEAYSGDTKVAPAHIIFRDIAPGSTDEILDILKGRNHTKATFFAHGDTIVSEESQKLLKRIVKEGHSIGSMGYTPVDFLYANNSYIEEQIVSADEQFKKVLGYAPRLFLPTFGALDALSYNILTQLGKAVVLWCAGANGFYFINNPDFDVNTAVAALRYTLPEAGGIILMPTNSSVLKEYFAQVWEFWNFVDFTTCTGRSASKSKGAKSAKTLAKSKGAKRAKAGAKSSKVARTYIADLGDFGTVTMLVDGDEFAMDIKLENINDDMFPEGTNSSALAYHLHSGQVGLNMNAVGALADGSADLCGKTYTLGHYDPEVACGKASTATKDPPVGTGCDPAGYPVDGNYEIGDLSNIHGKVLIDGDGEGEKSIDDGNCPDCDGDYLENPKMEDATFETWLSIVFHADNGDRVLCANFVR